MAQPVNSTHMATDNFEVRFVAHTNFSSHHDISQCIWSITNFLFDSYCYKRVARARNQI